MTELEVRAVFAAADTLVPARYAEWFTEDGKVTFGNNPPAIGAAAIEIAVATFYALLDGMAHTLVGVWPMAGEPGWLVEAEVQYRVKGRPEPVPVLGVTVLRTAGNKVRDARLYCDLAPVFSAAQAARGQAPASPALPTVEHQAEGHRGAFTMERDGRRLAELTYSLANQLIIIDHTEVDPVLRGTGAGVKLVEASVAWARTEGRKVLPLCPFARSVFSRRADLRDVLTS